MPGCVDPAMIKDTPARDEPPHHDGIHSVESYAIKSVLLVMWRWLEYIKSVFQLIVSYGIAIS